MSGSTVPPAGSTGAVTTVPVLSTGNMVGAPASTAAGLGIVGGILTQLATNGLPTTGAGWFGVGMQALMSLGAVFLRA